MQTVGALGMSLAHGKIKRKYAIDDERAAVRADAGLRDVLKRGSAHAAACQPVADAHGGGKADPEVQVALGRLVGTLAATVTMAIYGKRGAGRRLGAAHARGAPRRDADGYCWAGRVAT